MDCEPLVTTITERCRLCYTCVRECPAKAIRIAEGQACVLPERCIACGNCVRVCSQNAKQVRSSREEVRRLLDHRTPVTAIIAPSFPAEFDDLPTEVLVGMVRALGFTRVHEVAFGADLVARRYRELLDANDGKRYIATSCPAIVEFVTRYHPDLIPSLAPVVSPMVATARALRCLHGTGLQIVFIGPCIAKKTEATLPELPGEVQSVLTFTELRALLDDADIRPEAVSPSDFDPPHAGWGQLFPISRGVLQAAGIHEDLAKGEVMAADGRHDFVRAIEGFEKGSLDARLLEVLACNGCIMGAGMTTTEPIFSRRSHISRHVRQRMATRSQSRWQNEMERFAGIDLTRRYGANDQRMAAPCPDVLKEILARLGKFAPEDELNCGACGYETCREHAMAIHKGLAETEMCLPYTIERLRNVVRDLKLSHTQLADAQEALMHSERLASMGQLAAGVAHEVNNPLGVVLVYAHLLLEEAPEGSSARQDLSTIVENVDRCKKIVSRLLDLARRQKLLVQAVDVRELVSSSLRAVQTPPNITVRVENGIEDPVCDLDFDQITQVLTNLINNAFQAMSDGGTLTLSVDGTPDEVRFDVSDTGMGIPEENLKRIFDPFYTTKGMGKGTGLGLTVSYGIVKMHRGDIQVHSNARPDAGAAGTTFSVTLPRRDAT